jgi:hypothetical protein
LWGNVVRNAPTVCHQIIAATLLLLVVTTGAEATLLEAQFGGTISLVPNGTFTTSGGVSLPNTSLLGTSFSATFVFDTALGSLSSPAPGINRLDGGVVSTQLVLPGIETFGNIFIGDVSILQWSSDFSSVLAASLGGGGFFSLNMGLGSMGPDVGFFQTGTCPGRPCGFGSIDQRSVFEVVVGVPGPLVGAGFPGIVLAFGGLLMWWRRFSNNSPARPR